MTNCLGRSACLWRSAAGIAAAAFLPFISNFAMAQVQDAHDIISNNDSIFIDGKTFKIIPGKATSIADGQIKKLGAREMGPGALIFRSGDRLYIVDTPLLVKTNRVADRRNFHVSGDEAQTNRIRIEYVSPKNAVHEKLHDMMKLNRALETLQDIFSPLRLPVDVTIRSVGCDGVANAWYERQYSGPTVSLCYEYLQEIFDKIPQETTPTGFTPSDTVIGQFFYAAAHEVGHAAFDIFDVPVFGREEDAADQFAIFIMLQFGMDRARRLIGGAAYSYNEFITNYKKNTKVVVPLAAFSSNHGSPEERFYNLLCMAYGADAILFADMVENGFLPPTRAESCHDEYRVLAYAFRHQISPHVDLRLAREVLDTTWFATKDLEPPRR